MKKFFVLGLIAFAGSLALASADGTATGKLTINNTTTNLSYAYAWTAPDPFDESKTNVIVMLSDVKLTPDDAMDDFKPTQLAKEKKLNAVRLQFDADGEITSGNFYSPLIDTGQFSAGGMHKFDKQVFTSASIEGKAFMEKPEDFFETKYFYTATFKAPIVATKKK